MTENSFSDNFITSLRNPSQRTLESEATMPNCFSLTKIGETEPMKLTQIDELICGHLGVKVHPTQWVYGWYDIIGFGLAMGKTFDDFIDNPDWSDRIQEIAKFLKDNFKSDAW